MNPAPPDPDLTDPEQHRAESHRRMLDRLAALGMELAETVVADVADGADRVAATAMFDTLGRSVRRSILLCERIGELAQRRAATQRELFAGRAAVTRQVEDAIQREWCGEDVPRLEQELHERLDAPEFIDELATRPVEELIEEICHDLGLHDPANQRLWKRRPPVEVRALWDRAVARCRVRPAPVDAYDREPAMQSVELMEELVRPP